MASLPDNPGMDLQHTRQFLNGYNLLEWPDLSATRAPSDDIHSTTLRIPHIAEKNYVPETLTAISRILGAYCGVSDVLLAVQLVGDDGVRFVRVTWSESDTWADVATGVNHSIMKSQEGRVSIETIRRVLDISDKQSPCLALCQFSSNPAVVHSSYALTFIYDIAKSTIHLSSSQTHTHPSISSQILAQLSALTAHAQAQPSSLFTSVSSFPSGLNSVYDRAPDGEALAKAYSHLSPARFAADYLAQRAIVSPGSTAVRWYPSLSSGTNIDDCKSITYGEQDKKANQAAWWLRKLGLKNEDRVAVCMNRDLDFHVALIAIMRSGGCYVPIDPELPLERKAYIARDSGARFVLTSADVSPPSLFGDLGIFFDSTESQNAIRAEIDVPLNFASLDGLAFLLYTSGTTGNPKGCLLTHSGLSQALLALSSTAADVRMEDLTQGRYLAVASVAFDVHLAETFVPLTLGMPLYSAPRSQLLENLPFFVQQLGITHLGIVPSLIEATMGAVQERGGERMALRYIASGGEKMSDSILDKWANHPQVRLANFYGPSEATIGCCARFMDHKTPRANIGRPFANVSAYVVDSNLNILLRGGVGELVVEGPLIGRGYHGRPDLTEKVFLEWPEKGRWAYRTGDLVRMMPDSTLEILGRIDTQIKLRGVRIESEGISSIVRKAAPTSSTFMLDATTVLAKHPLIGAEQLVSFIAWDPSVSVATRKSSKPLVVPAPRGLLESIRHVCDVELARYMRPSHIIPLSWLPLSSNGKSDAKSLIGIFNGLSVEALAALMANNHDVSEARPVTKLEQDVFAVLARHSPIPLPFPHPHINIFECGLDSMAVIRFASDLKVTLGRSISVSDIMLTPTLSAITSLLQSSSSEPSPASPGSHLEKFLSHWKKEVYQNYPQDSIENILPPFSVQEGVLSRSAVHETMYVQHVIVACKSDTALGRLRSAWQAIVERHSILRTVFHFSNALIQVVLRFNASKLSWEQKETILTDGREFARWFLETEAAVTARNINKTLSVTSPLRICVYASGGPTFVVLSIHHALFDGISLPFLMTDVEREYLKHVPRSPAISSEILDQIACIDWDKARAFWVDYFKGFAWSHKTLRRAAVTPTTRQVTAFKHPLSIVRSLPISQQVTLRELLTCTFASIAANKIYQSSGAFWVNYFKWFAWSHKTPLSRAKSLPTSQQVTLQALLTCTFASIIAKRIYQSNGAFLVGYLKGFVRSHKTFRRAAVTPTKRQVTAFKSPLSIVNSLATSQQVTLQALLTCTFASIVANKIYRSNDVSFGVIRSGRLIPVCGIETAMAPMVSVVPARVNFGVPGNILHQIQHNISTVVEFEHVPLGKVQSWVRPGESLFDILFSVSVKVNTASEIWDVLDSEQPEPDYVLSLEVVIDQEHDSLSVQGAWTEGDLDTGVVAQLMEEFEDITLKIGAGSYRMIGEDITLSHQVVDVREAIDESDETINVNPHIIRDLRRILSEFLGVDERIITEATSFISLGLDSIKSVGLSRTLRKQGYHIAAIDLMKFSTLKKLGNYVENQLPGVLAEGAEDQNFPQILATLRASTPLDQFRLTVDDQISIFPTTTLQAGMLSQTISSEGSLYVHAFPLKLMNGVSVDRLRESWNQAIQTFTILRTSFHFITDAGIWVQAVHSSSPLQWVTDTFRSESDYHDKTSAYLLASRPKDEKSLCRPPIWIHVFEPTPENHDQAIRLVLVMHHALYDGISIGKLLDSVKAMYAGSYTDVPIQFTDLLGHFAQQETTGTSFFTQMLQGYHPAYLPRRPLNLDSPDVPASCIALRNVVFDPIYLESVLRDTAVTLQCLGQAAWAVLMSLLSGTSDVVFGHIVSGRSIPGAENVIGPVLNTIPCRVRLVEGLRNSELLKLIHQSNVDALPWQQASLRTIQKALGISSLWDSLFLFQPFTPDGSPDSLWEFDVLEEEVKIQYAINVEVVQQSSESFTLKVACRPDCMTLDELENLVQEFQTVLESLVSQPDALVLTNKPELMFASNNTSVLARDPTEGAPGAQVRGDVSISLIQELLVSITNNPSNQITPTTPLVALGIDSITAIQISGHFRRAGMKLAVNDIVTSRTVADMVARVDILPPPGLDGPSKPTTDTGLEIPATEKEAILARLGSNASLVERIVPASSGMKWLIGAWQRSDRSQFQHTFVYRLPDGFNTRRIREAWISLLQRLPLLRSTFVCAKGGLEPRIVTFETGHFEDWTEEQVGNDEILLPTVFARMKEFVSSPPPTNRPPTRGAIFHSRDRCYFAMHLHHFQFDAWTLPLIIDDLSRLYLGLDTITTNDISSFLRAYASNPEYLEVQREYWQTTFPQRFTPALLPPLIPHTLEHRSERVIYTTKAAITNAALCEERARSLHVSLQAVFLACWAQVQGKHSAADFTTLGLWQAGRSGLIDDIARLVSPCSNIVPMYFPGLEADTIDLAKKVQDDLRARTAPIVQSDLVQVDTWVGANGKPLCNVVVNIVRIAPDVTSQEGYLEQVELPYFIPDEIPPELNSTLDRLPVTDLIQNDLIVDIATLPNEDSVLMSFDAAPHIMDIEKAKELVEEWAYTVMKALGVL